MYTKLRSNLEERVNMCFVVSAISYEDGAHRYIVGERSFTESQANDLAKESSNLIGVTVEQWCPDCQTFMSNCVCDD